MNLVFLKHKVTPALITLFMVVLFVAGCTNKNLSAHTALSFLTEDKYTISTRVKDIPEGILEMIPYRKDFVDRATEINMGCSEFVYASDTSFLRIPEDHPANAERKDKRIHFTAFNDSYCMIVYRTGGFAIYDYILFFNSQDDKRYERYEFQMPFEDSLSVGMVERLLKGDSLEKEYINYSKKNTK